MTLRAWFSLAFSILAGVMLLDSQPEPPQRPGPQPDGRIRLVTGASLRPAGRQIPLETLPMSSAVSPDGRFVVILQAGYLPPRLTAFALPGMEERGSLPLPDGWLGLRFAAKESLLYVSGGSRAEVYEISLDSRGQPALQRTFVLVKEAERKHTDFAGDVALSPDGRLLYVAALYRDSIFVINLQTGIVIEEWKTGHRPYRILPHPDGRWLYVSGWGDGFLYRHNAQNGQQVSRVPLGPQPMDLIWRDKPVLLEGEEGDDSPRPASYVARIFAAVSNTNSVASVAIAPDGSMRLLERLNFSLYPEMPAGMTPASLALSEDHDRLLVTCSDANAIGVADVSGSRSRILGFVPTGWYPVSLRILPGGRLLVLNGRGARSFPNPQGPNPARRPTSPGQGVPSVQYVGLLQRGSASLVDPFTQEQLDDYSAQVLRNTPYETGMLSDAGVPPGSPVPANPGRRGPIRHVIYIVKENRTYDQVLGDLGIGNGDPSLTLFGEEVTPNQHQLARDFVLLDNFYVNADVSADGHNWSAAAIAPAYIQLLWQNSYGRRRRHYDYEGGERAAAPPAGYIWNNALAAGLSFRNYGWWATGIQPRPESGRQVAFLRDPALAPHTCMEYRPYDLDFPDHLRVQPFLRELRQWEEAGAGMPEFIVMRLGNNHTSGTTPGKPTPRAAVADNDHALGLIVEAVSRTRFWPRTAIFVLEDDAQNGPDHIDSHRAPAFVISPYTRGRGIDSTMYNTVSMLRTMELLLGMRPMTMHDAGAVPMWRTFLPKPDPRPWQARPPRIDLSEKNPPANPTAARSLRLDFSEADRIDDEELNEILWLAVRGSTPPAPSRSFFGR